MHRILFLSLLGCFFQVSAQSLVWNTEWGGTLDDRVSGCVENADQSLTFSAATAANDGDVSLNHGEWDGWIFQVDAQGGLMWEKTFGGSQEDYLNALVATPDGGWVACGQSNSSDGDISQNQGSFDVWVLKLNADASIAWSKTFGGADYEAATQIQVWDSTFIIAGYTYSLDGDVVGAKGGRDAWVFQLSEAGDWIWGKVLGGSGEDKITAIEVDYLIYFVGETSSSDGDIPSNKGVLDVWEGTIDSQGNLLSSHTWGGTKGDYGIRTCHDMAGCQYLVGNSYSSDGDIWGINKGNLDIWVMKKSAGGQVLWSHNFGGSLSDGVADVLYRDGVLYLICNTKSYDGDIYTSNRGDFDWLLMRIDTLGTLISSHLIGGNSKDIAQDVCGTADGSIILSGYSESTNFTFKSIHGGVDGRVIKIAPLSLSISSTLASPQVQVFPNPSHSSFYLTSSHQNIIQYKLFDITGVLLAQEQLFTSNCMLSLAHFPQGVYQLQITLETGNTFFLPITKI